MGQLSAGWRVPGVDFLLGRMDMRIPGHTSQTGNARLSAVRISMDRADARLCSHESGVYSSCSQDVMEVCHQQDRNDVAAQHCFSHFFTSAEWPRHLMEDMDGSVL